MSDEFDFYSKTSLKSYNLNETMRYQLSRLDTLDVFTRKHSENVASLVCRLCENLNLDPSFTVYCTTCAYLHDLGKIFVPHEVLQKNGKLTDEEYAIIKSHTTHGYEICLNDPLLKEYSNGALYHHESLDGTGYPNGATIETIPLEAQIIRVADEYDAIINKRQYKTHIGVSDTLKILIDKTYPTPAKPEDNIDKKLFKIRKKYGKMNKKIVKQLVFIVIADIKTEIDSIKAYVDDIKTQLDRLTFIGDMYKKYTQSTNGNEKESYVQVIRNQLAPGETMENMKNIFDDYVNAYKVRSEKINNLYKEIEIIKKFKI